MRLNHPHPKLKDQQGGFTIIELLIASMVFAVILLLITMGILQVTRVYYKGLTESNTQNTARTVSDIIAQAIQFNGGVVTTTQVAPTPGVPYAFCVGNQQFSYTTGYQLADNPNGALAQSHHVLVVDTVAGCTSSTPPQNVRNASVTGRELMGSSMRLTKLDISSLGNNLYQIDVVVSNGEDDLLTNPTGTNAKCISTQSGGHFCAQSTLSTVAVKRVQ